MATGKCIQTLLSGRLVDCTEIPEFLFETKFECSADWLSLDLWLSLALTRSLWLSLALSGSGSIRLSVLHSVALFGSLWLSLAASGSLCVTKEDRLTTRLHLTLKLLCNCDIPKKLFEIT